MPATVVQLIEEEIPRKRRGRGKRLASIGHDGPTQADAAKWDDETHDPKLSHWEKCAQCSTWVELGLEAADDAGRPCPSCGEQVNEPFAAQIACTFSTHMCPSVSPIHNAARTPSWHVQMYITLSYHAPDILDTARTCLAGVELPLLPTRTCSSGRPTTQDLYMVHLGRSVMQVCRRRYDELESWVQCDSCGKWRSIARCLLREVLHGCHLPNRFFFILIAGWPIWSHTLLVAAPGLVLR